MRTHKQDKGEIFSSDENHFFKRRVYFNSSRLLNLYWKRGCIFCTKINNFFPICIIVSHSFSSFRFSHGIKIGGKQHGHTNFVPGTMKQNWFKSDETKNEILGLDKVRMHLKMLEEILFWLFFRMPLTKKWETLYTAPRCYAALNKPQDIPQHFEYLYLWTITHQDIVNFNHSNRSKSI